MSRVVLAILIVCFSATTVSGTQAKERNRIYGEFLGPGLLYSLNYERAVTETVGLRVGAGGWPASGFRYGLGLGMLVLYVGGGSHRAVIGLGGAVAWFADVDLLEQTDVVGGYAAASVGYQFQPRGEGLFFRISYTPLASGEAVVPLWAGAGIGWTF